MSTHFYHGLNGRHLQLPPNRDRPLLFRRALSQRAALSYLGYWAPGSRAEGADLYRAIIHLATVRAARPFGQRPSRLATRDQTGAFLTSANIVTTKSTSKVSCAVA